MLDQNMSLLAVTPKTVNSLKQLNAQGLPPTDLSTIETPNPITQGIRNPQQTAQEETDDYNGMFKIVDTSTYDNNGNIIKAEFGVVHGATFDREKKTSEDSIAHYLRDRKIPATFTDLTVNENYDVYLALSEADLEFSITNKPNINSSRKYLGRIMWRNGRPVIEQLYKGNVCVFDEPPPYYGSLAIVDVSTYNEKDEIVHAEFGVVNTEDWDPKTRTGSSNYFQFTPNYRHTRMFRLDLMFSTNVSNERKIVKMSLDDFDGTSELVIDKNDKNLSNLVTLGAVRATKKGLVITQIYKANYNYFQYDFHDCYFYLRTLYKNNQRQIWLVDGNDSRSERAGVCVVNNVYFDVPKQQILQEGDVWIAARKDNSKPEKIAVDVITGENSVSKISSSGYFALEHIGTVYPTHVAQDYTSYSVLPLPYYDEWFGIVIEDEQ